MSPSGATEVPQSSAGMEPGFYLWQVALGVFGWGQTPLRAAGASTQDCAVLTVFSVFFSNLEASVELPYTRWRWRWRCRGRKRDGVLRSSCQERAGFSWGLWFERVECLLLSTLFARDLEMRGLPLDASRSGATVEMPRQPAAPVQEGPGPRAAGKPHTPPTQRGPAACWL